MTIAERWKGIKSFYWKRIATDLQRANHDVRVHDRFFSRLIEEAEKAGNHKEVEALQSEWSADLDGDRAEVEWLISRYWQRRATSYRIPLPPDDEDHWGHSRFDNRKILTIVGIDFIENRIYDKRKKRWEFWLALAPTAIGVIGALTGLFAILFHRSK